MLPVLKWTGGKRKLVKDIIKLFPQSYDRYYEPMVGGGALFFHLQREGSYISDVNEELINFYSVVRDIPTDLMNLVDTYENTPDKYNEIREWDRLSTWAERSNLERAARFLYLNKTAYSGLWRVNKSNQFNVPYGKYTNPKFYNKDEIIAASKLLQKTQIELSSYEAIKKFIKPGDLIYFDPPYVPISATSSFTSYTKDGFDNTNQIDLKTFCDELTDMKVNWIASNSYSPAVFDLYGEYNLVDVVAGRAISAGWDGANSKVKELIIRNFE